MSNIPLTICRICEESKETSLVDITLSQNKDLVVEFLACANVSYNIHDKLPKYFCLQCVSMLNDAYNFKGQCERTEKKLLQLLCKEPNIKNLGNETNYASPLEYIIKTEYPIETKIQNATENNMEPIKSTDDENDLSDFDQSILMKEESSDVDLLADKPLLSASNKSVNRNECEEQFNSKLELTSHHQELKKCTNINLDIKIRLKSKSNIHTRSYTCDICNKSSRFKCNLVAHMRKVHKVGGDTPFKCIHCPKQFSTARGLKLHSLYSHKALKKVGETDVQNINLNVFTCDICKKRFKSKSKIERHMFIHSRTYTCDICNKSSRFKCNLVAHMQKVHSTVGGDTPFKCVHCSKQFSTARGLKLHDLYSHKPSKNVCEKTYECDDCANKFTTANRLKQHILIQHTQAYIEKPYKCLLCSFKFRHKESFDNHTLKHQTNNFKPKKFICAICGYGCVSLSHLKNHMTAHSDERPYTCNLCDSSFKGKQSLTQHIRKHTGEKPYKCLECDRAFACKEVLNAHKTTHNKDRPYECLICKEKFRSPVTLRGHMTRHTGEKPYNCENCEKSFINYPQLKKHLRTHTGTKPYACTFCNIGFAKMKIFEKHLGYHNGNESYKGIINPRRGYHQIHEQYVSCSWCYGGFLTNRFLKYHQTKHSGGKAFTCQICGQGFSTTNSLNEHKIVYHQNGVVQ